MREVVQFNPERPVMDAELFQHPCFHKEMNVLVNRGEGNCRDTLLRSAVDLFRGWVATHLLQDLIKNLPLVRRGEPMLGTKFTKVSGLDGPRVDTRRLGAGKGSH